MILKDYLRFKTNELISHCVQLFNEIDPKEFERIKRWAKYAKTDESYYTAFSLTQSIYDTLWSIPEAIEEGFSKYLERRKTEYAEMLNYHNLNCEKRCVVCEDRQVIKDLLGIDYERNEP